MKYEMTDIFLQCSKPYCQTGKLSGKFLHGFHPSESVFAPLDYPSSSTLQNSEIYFVLYWPTQPRYRLGIFFLSFGFLGVVLWFRHFAWAWWWSRLNPNCYGCRNKIKSKKLGRNRGIPKTQLGFSLDQKKSSVNSNASQER
jgi:hypothetical protein